MSIDSLCGGTGEDIAMTFYAGIFDDCEDYSVLVYLAKQYVERKWSSNE